MSSFSILQATPSESLLVGEMIYEMEKELWENEADKLDKQVFIDSADKLIRSHTGFWAFLARDKGGNPVGVITLNECCAIYAGGTFGEIMEMYIAPEYRSQGIGQQLLTFTKTFAKEQNWQILEVGSPAQPRWSRTFDFYTREGFKEIGPRLELVI